VHGSVGEPDIMKMKTYLLRISAAAMSKMLQSGEAFPVLQLYKQDVQAKKRCTWIRQTADNTPKMRIDDQSSLRLQ
jgi:hypothetical protein